MNRNETNTSGNAMIAYCGLKCDSCPVRLATLEKDETARDAMKVQIAEQCFQVYGVHMSPDDVTDCDGCKANTGILFPGCSGCKIRLCAISKSLENCAYCDEYACKNLMKHFSYDPASKKILDDIRIANTLKTN